MAENSSVLTQKEGKLFRITINRPEAKNAINRETDLALQRAWREFQSNDQLWVAVLTGAGDNFCAGADLKEMSEFKALSPQQRKDRFDREPWIGGITHNIDIFKPIVAAIDGPCLGGGLELAMACDLRIATRRVKLGLPEAMWGIIPAAGGTQRLPRLVGMAKALEMILLAQKISAEEALRIGLVNFVVEDSAALAKKTNEVAEQMLSLGPLALRAAKESILRGFSLPLEEGLRLEQLIAEINRANEDSREGPRAFAERRPAQFQGR